MLRGSKAARIDDKGRLKVPNVYRNPITEKYGDALYVTSIDGESVLIYPMTVWMGIEEKLQGMPASLPARQKYVRNTNYYGQQTEFDRQGRVSVHGHLRESAGMAGEVDVFGNLNHLQVWNHERFAKRLKSEPLTEEDFSELAKFGI